MDTLSMHFTVMVKKVGTMLRELTPITETAEMRDHNYVGPDVFTILIFSQTQEEEIRFTMLLHSICIIYA